jgi:hypothetical protein
VIINVDRHVVIVVVVVVSGIVFIRSAYVDQRRIVQRSAFAVVISDDAITRVAIFFYLYN